MGGRGRGFTLIEMMLVIAILAILALIMVPNFMRARSRSQLAGCEGNLKALGTSLEAYAADNAAHYPSSMDGLVSAGTLRYIPTCPATARDTYSEGYETHIVPDIYTIECGGSNHGVLDIPSNFPQYSSIRGLAEQP